MSTAPKCDPGPTYLMWTLRLAYSTIFILGTFGNAVVCLAILKRKRMQNSCTMFTFNLAFHDLILVILYVPTQMIAMENCYSWTLGDFMCHLVYIILPLSLSVSIGTLLAITADRYRAIVFPVKARLSKKTVILITAVIWIVSALTVLPLLFVIKVFSPMPGVQYCFEQWPSEILSEAYWVSIFVIQYLLPLCAIVVLAGITAYTLRKNSLPAAMESCAQSEMFRKTVRKRVKQTQRITNMLIALVLLYAICMLPQHVVYTFWARYGNLANESYREQANVIANMFPIANSALNAIAYGTLNKEFKAVFKGLFSCVCFKMSGRRDLFRRNLENTSVTDAPTKRSLRGQPLLQEWRNGREAMLSPVPKNKRNEVKQSSIRDLPANQGRTRLGMGRVDCRKLERKKFQLLVSAGKTVEERETVL